jgi:NAD(P)-dependent dehydrogenase (short-subunit alcohol dehydrogenase family)
MARTVVITGSASGIGASLASRLRAKGDHVIGIDVRGADVTADLGTRDGRIQAVADVRAATDTLDAVVTCAGLAGLSDRPGDVLASVNYFGTIAVLEGLRPLLAASALPAALVFSSNSTSTQPGVPMGVVDALLAEDEELARKLANEASSVMTYPATKMALARWVRRHAVGPDWVGAGIRLNALAPGSVNTAMTAGVREDPVFGQFIDQFPVPTGPGAPEDIAAIADFLISAEARFFCGSIVYVDGGTDALLRPDDWPAGMPIPH